MTDSAPTARTPRVQRLVERLPVVHLEAEVPAPDPGWTVTIDGLVATPLTLTLTDLKDLGADDWVRDFHCVWGWSRQACRWTGIPVARLLDLVRLDPAAQVVDVACKIPPYLSCVRVTDARSALLAWALDGAPIPPDNGGPLRFVQPPWLWGYKGVKWVGRLTITDTFVPGFWEGLVGNPEGRVPEDILAPFAVEDAA